MLTLSSIIHCFHEQACHRITMAAPPLLPPPCLLFISQFTHTHTLMHTHTLLDSRQWIEPVRLRCITAQVGRSVRVAIYIYSCSTPPTHHPHISDSRQCRSRASQVKACHSTGRQVCQSGYLHVTLCG